MLQVTIFERKTKRFEVDIKYELSMWKILLNGGEKKSSIELYSKISYESYEEEKIIT